MLMLALSFCIGFSVSAQVPEKENEDMPTQEKPIANQDGEHWIMKDGKVIHVEMGVETIMDTETEVNGVWIRPNGQVVKKDNKVIQLKEGQYVDSMGKIHKMKKKMSKDK